MDLTWLDPLLEPFLGGQLSQPWVVLPALGAVVLVALVIWLVLRRRGEPVPVAVANTELLRNLPEYRRAVRRQRWMVAGRCRWSASWPWPPSSGLPVPCSG